jgi:hypothetical protein
LTLKVSGVEDGEVVLDGCKQPILRKDAETSIWNIL